MEPMRKCNMHSRGSKLFSYGKGDWDVLEIVGF
jgi:hypothetical protein